MRAGRVGLAACFFTGAGAAFALPAGFAGATTFFATLLAGFFATFLAAGVAMGARAALGGIGAGGVSSAARWIRRNCRSNSAIFQCALSSSVRPGNPISVAACSAIACASARRRICAFASSP